MPNRPSRRTRSTPLSITNRFGLALSLNRIANDWILNCWLVISYSAMTGESGDIPSKSTREERQPTDTAFKNRCCELGEAVSKHDVGETTAKVQQLIMQYYLDVQGQATQSFESAKAVALLGFALFAATISYVIFTDLMPHIHQSWFTATKGGMGVGTIGLISGSVVEVIAGTQFFLYRNSARQFGAFHICLERTHR